MMNPTVCIVGASLAGYRTAVALRDQGFTGRIRLVGQEPYLPYDRPPLSKAMLLSPATQPPRWLTTSEELAERRIDLSHGVAATGLRQLDTGWSVELADGHAVECDVVVIATGATARQPLTTRFSGVHTLRTLEDHLRLRSAMLQARSLVVVGGGFIGCEVAAAAVTRGLTATVVEALPAPLARVLGEDVGGAGAALLRSNGVVVRCGHSVHSITGEDDVADGIMLSDGERLAADVVLVAVGARPSTEWLANSAIPISDGVLCDQYGAAVGVSGVFAVGDAARWWHPGINAAIRAEHWSSVSEQAVTVAANIMDHRSRPLASVPYVWSDQFDKKLQIIGWPSPDCSVHWIEGSEGSDRVAVLYENDGVVVAAFAIGNPQFAARARRTIADRTPLAVALRDLAAAQRPSGV